MNNFLKISKSLTSAVTAGILLYCVVLTSAAAPKSELLDEWDASDENSTKTVSHQAWQSLLDRYLKTDTEDGVYRFAYGDVSKADRKSLENYLEQLAETDPRTLTKAKQKAYWINLYNALTVNLILDEYPVSSIRKIRFLTSLFGPWDKNLIEIADEDLTLNDIEHRILRPIWKDPRIHFAVNCASIGCPNLLPSAFTADNMEELLNEGTQAFINHPRGVDREGERLKLSSIFEWYMVDFGGTETTLIDYLREYLNDEKLNILQDHEGIDYSYDWSLNEAK